jgi:hypothetical protein
VAVREDLNPHSDRWRRLVWSTWVALGEASPPNQQGTYRLRCRRRKGLLYIGISENLATRLGRLRRALNRDDHRGHYAARGIAAERAKGCSVEVSWVVMDPLSRRELMGKEVDLIAAHRAAFGDSPTCQFAGGRLGAE